MSKFASLTSGLLARKGSAEPAATAHADTLLARVDASGPDFRAQGAFGRRGGAGEARAWAHRLVQAVEPVIDAPEQEPVPEAIDSILAFTRSAMPSTVEANPDPDRLYHVNLRLRRKRFVKLKLSAALMRRPTQDIVSEALDQWFDRLPPDVLGDCACLRGP